MRGVEHAGERVAGADGLGEVVAGLQEQHVDAGQRAGRPGGAGRCRRPSSRRPRAVGRTCSRGPGDDLLGGRRRRALAGAARRAPGARRRVRVRPGPCVRRRSSQGLLVGAVRPGGERLAGVAVGDVARGSPARRSRAGRRRSPSGRGRCGRGRRPRGRRRPARRPGAPGRRTPRLPSALVSELALQADVGDLDPGAGVRAAVDVQADRHGRGRRRSSRRLELGDGRGRRRPWSRRRRACSTRCRCRPSWRGGTGWGRPAGPSGSTAATRRVDLVGRRRRAPAASGAG